ncbi:MULTISPECIES: hypothetical protein [Clostridium]|uniref:Uncharacterized protein n=3 Tax=Clostridium TaxID=1485 RepID=A0A162LF52_9CLOT|nr:MULTISPECIES: hypothetical protein [Clostridium]AGY75734.1 hypothetical protein CAETHG_1511 [Clostridium autoethanogenum DSM 10061]ALU35899.1 Hypothetical protein CLAU_1470 [Clostridium autoethanogenum DSM 10061]OAA89487.1 hypothetical protein WX45_01319 [Clostridium ljungdahlii DSM 13528]OAA92706.1 hypothetical protein WX73_00798 [Clostridium coskatii]OBR94632.1 hypothetical protein CLCOS_18710 [Clostridium coskatii]
MTNIKYNKTPHIKFKHSNDKFNMEAARELGIDFPNFNQTTSKIIYAYELGLNDRL